jgi:hypothetical protein
MSQVYARELCLHTRNMCMCFALHNGGTVCNDVLGIFLSHRCECGVWCRFLVSSCVCFGDCERSQKVLNHRTRSWCGHEYTVSNLEFAMHADPTNGRVRVGGRSLSDCVCMCVCVCVCCVLCSSVFVAGEAQLGGAATCAGCDVLHAGKYSRKR